MAIDGLGGYLYGVEKEIRIELINDRILSYGIDLNRLTEILQSQIFQHQSGKLLMRITLHGNH